MAGHSEKPQLHAPAESRIRRFRPKTICGRLRVFRNSLAHGKLYRPLPTGSSVRLLRLEPGHIDDAIKCTLHCARLDRDHQPYEALSYVWGSRHETINITCNKHKVPVTENLYEALLRLRKPDEPRWIWVDALCINQSDPNERGHQVRQMHAIYKKAAKVIVWLGIDDYDEAHNAFAIICAIANTSHVKSWIPRPATFTTDSKVAYPDGPVSYMHDPPSLDSRLWRTVQSLFYNRYFCRMWVIQELVLAKSATFIWGDAEIDWKWVGIAVDHIRADVKLHALLESRNMQNAYFMHYLCGQQLDKYPNNHPFLHLLDWARSFDVSDPRDKIYGLLGFPTKYTSNTGDGCFVEPDYTLTVHEIYTEVAQKIVEQDQTLDLLSFVTHDHSTINSKGELTFDFPSWVPDWSQKIVVFPFMGFGGGNEFSAGKSRPMELLPSNNPYYLPLKGLQVDRISEALPYMPFVDLRDADNQLQQCVKHCQKIGLSPQDLSKTLTAGRCEHGWFIDDDERHVADFAAFLTDLNPLWLQETWPEQAKDLGDLASQRGNQDRAKEALWRYTCYRTAFFTANGKLGLGPATLRNDDFIVVLYGSQVPFVVRQEGEYYRFIGECYIADLMHGEAIEKHETGSSEVEEKVFELR